MSTDKDWEKWGATDPYFGVLSSERFRKDGLDGSLRQEFFATGTKHVEWILRLVSENFKTDFRPRTALDFGCGVGRLVLPLASRTERTLGVDISPSMLAEAAENAKAANIDNASFVLSDDTLSNAAGRFSLVHSYIVLQHIPWSRGRPIVQQLAQRVEPGGFLTVHFLTSANASRLVRLTVRLRYVLPPLHWLRNVLKRRPVFEPAMQLHCYNKDVIIRDLEAAGFEPPVCCDESGVAGFNGVFLLARRASGAA